MQNMLAGSFGDRNGKNQVTAYGVGCRGGEEEPESAQKRHTDAGVGEREKNQNVLYLFFFSICLLFFSTS